MKQILIFGCSLVLALIVMDTNQVVKTSLGLAVKGGQAYAADMPPRAHGPGACACANRQREGAVIGKGKGKGKAPPPVITKG